MPYEVDTVDGRCLYRGDDIELACEIHDQVPTAVLVVLPSAHAAAPATDRRTGMPWKGPAVAEHPHPTAPRRGCHETGRRHRSALSARSGGASGDPDVSRPSYRSTSCAAPSRPSRDGARRKAGM
jgi:hypothetical protein